MTSAKPAVNRKGGRSNSRSARRRAREFALQGLYQWKMTGSPVETIEKNLSDTPGFDKIDLEYFRTILRGTIIARESLGLALQPYLDRRMNELSPIEASILLLAGFELQQQLEVPYRVVINEAVELAKTFGGTEGHKYVNGVLDKLALDFRVIETSAGKVEK